MTGSVEGSLPVLPEQRERLLRRHSQGQDLRPPTHSIAQGFVIPERVSRQEAESGVRLVIRRHDALRAAFVSDDVQIIRSPRDVAVTWSRSPNIDLAKEVVSSSAAAPFDIGEGPLARVHGCETDQGETVLAVVTDHLVTDGYAFGLVAADLLRALSGREIQSPGPGLSYREYVSEQAEWLESPASRSAVTALIERLPDGDPFPAIRFELPVCRASAATGVEYVRVPAHAGALHEVRRVARAGRTTPAAVCFALLAAVIAQLTDAPCIPALVPFANRSDSRWASLVAWCSRVLPIPFGLITDASLLDRAQAIQGELDAARAHQRVPFESVLARTRPELLGRPPCVPFIFANYLYDRRPSVAPERGIRTFPVDMPSFTTALYVGFIEDQHDFVIRVQYPADRYARSGAEAFARFISEGIRSTCRSPTVPMNVVLEKSIGEWHGNAT